MGKRTFSSGLQIGFIFLFDELFTCLMELIQLFLLLLTELNFLLIKLIIYC
jgi:hypothetical protein